MSYPKFKVNINVQVEYILRGEDNVVIEQELFNLKSSNFIISRVHSKQNLRKILIKHLHEIINKEKDMNLSQSGWVSNKIVFVDLTFYKMNLLL